MIKKFLNVLSVIFSAIICLFLVLLLTVTPFYYSVTALTKPETVVKIIKNVDYKQLIEDNEKVGAVAESFGLDADKADKLMKSEEVGRMIEIYADEAMGVLMNIPTDKEWNSSLVKEIVNDNMDKIVSIANENTKIKISEEKLKKNINKTIDKNSELIESAAPVLEQVKIVVETVKASELIKRSMTPRFAIILSAVFVLCAAAVCLLRKKGFAGFLWLAIVFFVSVVLLGLIAIYSKSGFVNMLAQNMSDFGTEILTSAVSVYVEKLAAALMCSLAVGMIMLIVYTLCHKSPEKPQADAATE